LRQPPAEGEEPAWRLLNKGYVLRRLEEQNAATAEYVDVLTALMDLMHDPMGSETLPVRLLRGPAADLGIEDDGEYYNAELPNGWAITFELLPVGLPPLAGPLLRVRAAVRIRPAP
jgi:hypothetical protein